MMKNPFIKVMSEYDDKKLVSIISTERINYSEKGIEAAKIVLTERGIAFKEKVILETKEQIKTEKEKTPFQKRIEQRSRLKMYTLGALCPLFMLYGISQSSSHLTIGFFATLISWPLIYWQHQIDKKKT